MRAAISAGALDEGTIGLVTAREFSVWRMLELAMGAHARTLLGAGERGEADALATEALAEWKSVPGPITYAGVDFALCLADLGRSGELIRRPVLGAAIDAMARGRDRLLPEDYAGAAEIFAEIGSLPDEADARLRAAESAIRAGQRAEGDRELRAGA